MLQLLLFPEVGWLVGWWRSMPNSWWKVAIILGTDGKDLCHLDGEKDQMHLWSCFIPVHSCDLLQLKEWGLRNSFKIPGSIAVSCYGDLPPSNMTIRTSWGFYYIVVLHWSEASNYFWKVLYIFSLHRVGFLEVFVWRQFWEQRESCDCVKAPFLS